MANILPARFSDLEPFADWALPSERDRFAKRLDSTMDEMQAFYDVAFPLLEAETEYLQQIDMDNISEEDKHLIWLFCSLLNVAFPVDAWHQPRVPDSGASSIDAVVEPAV